MEQVSLPPARVSVLTVTSKTRGLLKVVLEDYFQASAFREIVPPEQWYRFDSRLEENTLQLFDLLGRFGAQATFFVSGRVGEAHRDLVRELALRGHEIASCGCGLEHPGEFRAVLLRSRESLERASGAKVLGYRSAEERNGPARQQDLEMLLEAGYAYHSSIPPRFGSLRARTQATAIRPHQYQAGLLWEVPVSSCSVLKLSLPLGMGSWLRQLPPGLCQQVIHHWRLRHQGPFILSFQAWEFDPEQPRISGATRSARRAHYRHLDRTYRILEECLAAYEWVGVARHLGLAAASDRRPEPEDGRLSVPVRLSQAAAEREASGAQIRSRKPVTVVIPCFNERAVVPYLAKTLDRMQGALKTDYQLEFLFVDDGSTDGTADELQFTFGSRANCTVLRHPHNQGITAAILTGLRHAQTEIICSMDADCTFDPLQLKEMLPLLTEGVDMVTASPYHPQGSAQNVPPWRLALSRGASFLYRQVLRNKLFTYTSCLRVYRRSAFRDLRVAREGFVGVTEMLARLDLRGSRIVEHPAILEGRLLGRSKMKVFRTVMGHLGLMAELLVHRIRS